MGEVKSGDGEEGIEPAGQESAAVLPPDLEQERQEIEARIEQHVAQLQEIAEVFGIDTSKFSDEDDRSVAGVLKLTEEHLKKEPTPQILFWGIFRGILRLLSVEFQIGGKEYPINHPVIASDIVQSNPQQLSFCIQHSQKFIDGVAESSLLTPGEVEAIDYFKFTPAQPQHKDLNANDFVRRLPGRIIFVNLGEAAKEDSEIESFLNSLPRQPHDWNDLRRLIESHSQSPLREKMYNITSAESYERPRSYSESEMLTLRIFRELGIIINTRLWYLAQQAHSDDPRFKKIESPAGSEEYTVAEDFQFTEEDARKARELNLPWSRIEKETKE